MFTILNRRVDKALIQQSRILQLPEPEKWDLSDLQTFLENPSMLLNGAVALVEEDAQTWGSSIAHKSHSPDLVALRPRPKEDPVSSWVAKHAIFCLERCGWGRIKKPSRIHGVRGYKDTTIFKITYWITSIIASLVPIVSIIALYDIHSTTTRLVVIGVFNMFMSICVSGLTDAKRSEIFTITTA